MALRTTLKDVPVLSAAVATGVGNYIAVSDFRNAVFYVATSGNATLTVQIQGCIGTDVVDFTSAASISNPWAYIQAVDLSNGNPINGSSGFVFSGTDSVYMVEVNINSLDWLTFNVTSRSAGAVTVKGTLTDNR